MLLDLPDGWVDPKMRLLIEHGHDPQEFSLDRISAGLYWGVDWLAESLIIDDNPFDAKYGTPISEAVEVIRAQSEAGGPYDFGVCDRPEQVLERWPSLESDPDRWYLVLCRRITKEHSPDFRFHKWGVYIGAHDLGGCEHFGEVDGIDAVVTFSIAVVSPTFPPSLSAPAAG